MERGVEQRQQLVELHMRGIVVRVVQLDRLSKQGLLQVVSPACLDSLGEEFEVSHVLAGRLLVKQVQHMSDPGKYRLVQAKRSRRREERLKSFCQISMSWLIDLPWSNPEARKASEAATVSPADCPLH